MNNKSENSRKKITSSIPVVMIGMIFIITGLFIVLITDKAELHLFLNSLRTEFFDVFFKIVTFLGNGIFAGIVIIALLFTSFRYSLIIATGYIISGMIVQFFKHIVFTGMMRPVKWFSENGIDIDTVSGINYHSYLSFPSGHSASAFAVFAGLSLILKNRLLKISALFIAILTAYSRVYLSQHFFGDIIAGSFIGFICVYLAWWFLNDKDENWLNKSLIKLK